MILRNSEKPRYPAIQVSPACTWFDLVSAGDSGSPHFLHTEEVTGSIPVSPTEITAAQGICQGLLFSFCHALRPHFGEDLEMIFRVHATVPFRSSASRTVTGEPGDISRRSSRAAS